MKTFRKPYLSIFLSALILFVSCQQNEDIIQEKDRSFDYSLFNEFKSANIQLDITSITKSDKSSYDKLNDLQSLVNSNFNTSMTFHESIANLIDKDSEEIFEEALKNNWLNRSEVELAKTLISDVQNLGFDRAIVNYEQAILSQNLSDEDFLKQNIVVNVLRGQNYANQNLYNLRSFDSKSAVDEDCQWCKCIAATLALTIATSSLSTCITIVACGAASVAFYAAVNGVAAACGPLVESEEANP